MQSHQIVIGVVFVAVGIGQRSGAVAFVVHIDTCGRQRGDPDGAAVLGEIAAAGRPTDVGFGGQPLLGQQGETPIKSGVGRVVGRHRAEGVEFCAATAGKTRARAFGHLKLEHAVGGRHGKTAGADEGVVIDGDVGGIGIVNIDIGGLGTAGGRTDGSKVGVAPLLDGEKREPVGGIIAGDMADHQVGLHGLAGNDAGSFLDAAINKVGFTLVQNNVSGCRRPGTVHINSHHRAVLGGHDKKADVLKQFIGEVLSHRTEVVSAVINGG